ncbi:hypothetical protein ASJ79_21935 [Mycobacterium sp. NAZ190054]|nr:hypothetical protein ASJ79_21935 [Mycobacterium sp. NAZ190054]
MPVVPAGAPAAPPLTLPAVPLGDAVPGLPLLPATLPVPRDLVCEGTAWSSGRTEQPESVTPAAVTPKRDRGQW